MKIDQGANRSRNRLAAGWCWLAALLLAACAQPPAPIAPAAQESAEQPATNRQVFMVRGVVQEVRGQENEVVIKHEEIPNYMPAMTMPFEVKSAAELEGLATNDQVSFTMIVTEDEGWIENIRKIGVSAETDKPAERPKTRLVREVEPLAVGDKMPDYSFTNSLGRKISLSQLAGKAYAFSFIFTRCPFPNFCPRMNSNFARAYDALKAMPDAPANWHLLSISFDPDFDTPERLRRYSESYNSDPEKWDWVTGAMIDIDAITEQVGLTFAFENNTFNHNLRTVVVGKDGVIRQIFLGNEWKAEELAKEIAAGAK